jgi:hypothetical protein
LGTAEWYAISGDRVKTNALQRVIAAPENTAKANIISSNYINAESNYILANDTSLLGYVSVSADGGVILRLKSGETTPSGHLIYELATPTTETADPYQEVQIVDNYGTEAFVDTRDVQIPVGHASRYEPNLVDKLVGLPWDLSMIAPIENGTTASKAYSTGQYFLKDNKFCKALTSIASGATFTLNTNYSVTTVADELYTALQ